MFIIVTCSFDANKFLDHLIEQVSILFSYFLIPKKAFLIIWICKILIEQI